MKQHCHPDANQVVQSTPYTLASSICTLANNSNAVLTCTDTSDQSQAVARQFSPRKLLSPIGNVELSRDSLLAIWYLSLSK